METSRNSVVAVILFLAVVSTYAQESNFEVVRGRELELAQDPDLRAIAAEFNEQVNITISGQGDTAVLSEGVNARLDCLPWLEQFPGGSVAWYMQPLNIITGVPEGATGEIIPGLEGPNQDISGRFNEVFEILGVLINPIAEDPTSGIYTCEVCIARGFPGLEECHNATVNVWGIGAPPLLRSGNSTDGPFSENQVTGERVYLIGTDFCLNNPPEVPPDPMRSLDISCDLINDLAVPSLGIGEAFPPPNRIWEHNGIVVYDEVSFQGSFTQEFTDTFPELVTESLFDLLPDGGVRIQIINYNSSRESSVDAYNSVFGNWTCTLNNTFDSPSATTFLRECGQVPVLPTKPPLSPIVVADSGDTILIGCDVCIVEPRVGNPGVSLNCTAIEGTPELFYTWDSITDDGVEMDISDDEVLTVEQEGEYTCLVENMDGSAMASSNVFFVPRFEFTTTIMARGEELSSDGCNRLRRDPDEPVDACFLVGDRVEFNCDFTSDSDSELTTTIQTPNGTESDRNLTIASVGGNDAGDYLCIFNDSDCGLVELVLDIQVYDPARIVRMDPPPSLPGQENFVAGTVSSPQVVTGNTTVVLFCPTMGIPNPSENWRIIETDSRGRPQERRLQTGGDITITQGDLNGFETEILTITNFGPEHEGTYVCRTKNIAGVDAGSVALQAGAGTGVWDAGDFSECSLPCHLGVRTRIVVCQSSRDGLILPDSSCVAADRPNDTDTTACEALGPCFMTPFWKAYEWGPCSEGCSGGYRRRRVECIVPLTQEAVEEVECFDYRRPRTFEFCPITCCSRDVYPTFCRNAGGTSCGDIGFQRLCCWTCKLNVIP